MITIRSHLGSSVLAQISIILLSLSRIPATPGRLSKVYNIADTAAQGGADLCTQVVQTSRLDSPLKLCIGPFGTACHYLAR